LQLYHNFIADLCNYRSYLSLSVLCASGPEGRGEMKKFANRDTRKGVTSVETTY